VGSEMCIRDSNQTSALRGISETVLLGLLAAVVAYFVGDVLEQFFT
jgi:VIT1/CCC1 family predicted Fe2+/Mn2+ transporter